MEMNEWDVTNHMKKKHVQVCPKGVYIELKYKDAKMKSHHLARVWHQCHASFDCESGCVHKQGTGQEGHVDENHQMSQVIQREAEEELPEGKPS